MDKNQYVDGRYLGKVQDWHAGDSVWKASKVFEMIRKHRLEPRTICDVGCGAGEILLELQKKMCNNVKLVGFDISPQAISLSKQNENSFLKFYNQDFLQNSVTPSDLILLLDVFEHVPDYLGFLENLRTKSDWIIFHIPLDICARGVLEKSNYMMEMRKKYGHLHYFTKQTALATLTETGYQIADYFYTDDLEIAGPKGLSGHVFRIFRKLLYRYYPNFTASSFTHFNLLVLARGAKADRPAEVSDEEKTGI
ncbi:class I SAM-dependent methyltransferase [Nitrospira sp. T9]|uniref:class I SAM-dependent methyltransferase n=1 Tax=unclassified Nitrospira TaxID=2652172 RepID=UPI003F95D057